VGAECMGDSILGRESMVKGFLSGSLIAGAFTFSFGWFFQLLFLILAVMVFLDTSCVYRKHRHIMSYLFFAFVGLFIGLVVMVMGFMFWYIVIVVILMIGLYSRGLLFRKHKKTRSRYDYKED